MVKTEWLVTYSTHQNEFAIQTSHISSLIASWIYFTHPCPRPIPYFKRQNIVLNSNTAFKQYVMNFVLLAMTSTIVVFAFTLQVEMPTPMAIAFLTTAARIPMVKSLGNPCGKCLSNITRQKHFLDMFPMFDQYSSNVILYRYWHIWNHKAVI